MDCNDLAQRLVQAVERNRADALLLSGGLDSAIIASILKPNYCVTAALGREAPDLAYARQAAQKYCKVHAEAVFGPEKMVELVDTAVQVFRTFDPIEVRNSCVALAALERAKEDGHRDVVTGDGGDELFAGYNYLSRYYGDEKRLEQELARLWEVMHFSSRALGKRLGIEVRAPFLDSEFAQYAKSVPAGEKVGERGGEKWGKFLLRRCFERDLGALVWRKKMAQEQGAGTDMFYRYVEDMIDGSTYANRAKIALSEGVKLKSKEQLHYYAMFRSYNPPPREEAKERGCKRRCPECSGCFEWAGRFCRTCGAFPVEPVSL
ncbi:MAG TPA: asparagine synthase C-terminal domain-containing protein [Nitrososphaera sp.]|nr:asparagine synthase C-terminal domain-containing protein [Nitrososphaera sp.]